MSTSDTNHPQPLTAPFPYFGGKSKVAAEVWKRFGNPDSYVEPFGGSLAVLLARPHEHQWWLKKETVGDYAGHVVNFYRAVAAAPEKVASAASWPVTEADLTARHLYLVRYQDDLAEKLAADPRYYDVEAAGWWIWGISAWVGGDWLTGAGPWKPGAPNGPGVFRKMPMVAGSHGGKGVHRPLADLTAPPGEMPAVSDAYLAHITAQFQSLSDRLRRVRITCGSWARLTKSAADPGKSKTVAVFLDPPYDLTMRRGGLYGQTDLTRSSAGQQVHDAARDYALEAGAKPNTRVAYCSYDNDHETELFRAAGWDPFHWTASGGYGLQSDNRARDNRDKEVIWFSPACLNPASFADDNPTSTTLFDTSPQPTDT